ncbi:Exodeoxyribonuclease V gamma chain [Serratia fonticola]|uniref:Exodeoxyribonuclease V gamma chain n=1 Tax=Serratia fonticola TaxID=47917 RepID=A0A4U9V184_SERFO|nr:Exodeoxyribonuclease V gamma chain [Serratia fonticola]
MAELAERVREQRQENGSLELDIDVAGMRITGWLHQVQQDGLLRWRPATLSAVGRHLTLVGTPGVLLRWGGRGKPYVWQQEFRLALRCADERGGP